MVSAAPKARLALGPKTTNAKTKALQTPGAPADNDLGKAVQKSATVRKARLRISHTEAVKVGPLHDKDIEEPEIEYMPPRVHGTVTSIKTSTAMLTNSRSP